MDKIIGYNHTFSSTNIKPAFVETEIIGNVGYYAYYFILYPTGLAIVLAVPYELASISYNPYSNYFTTSSSLSNGMVKLASITPKIYQFVGASQILVSAGAGSNTRSNTSSNMHYKGYYTTPNPISLNTSTKRIVGQGTEYGSLPEILFIDPALGMGQTLSTNSVDTIRYPLYKKNNLYYKSTTTLDTNVQYLSVAGDAFSHSDNLSNLSQSGTKGYASRNKLGVILNTTAPNPQVPSNNSTFSQATTTNNTKDVYQTDNSRFMTEKFGIKDGNNGYQLSVAPNMSNAGGYYLGKESQSKVTYPTTQCSRDNPGELFRNDEGHYQGVQITQNDVFFIDQFVLQIKDTQFKIPLNGTVRYYHREGTSITRETALGNDIKNYIRHDIGSAVYTQYNYLIFSEVQATSRAGIEFYTVVRNGLGAPIEVNLKTPSYGEKYYDRNSNSGITSDNTGEKGEEDIKLTQKLTFDINSESSFLDDSGYLSTMNTKVTEEGYGFIQKPTTVWIQYNIPYIPQIPGITNNIPADSNDELSTKKTTVSVFGDERELLSTTNGKLYMYKQTHTATDKVILEFFNKIQDNYGILPEFDGSLIYQPNNAIIHPYTDSSGSSTFNYTVDYGLQDHGNTIGFSARIRTITPGSCDVIVAYPES